MASKWLAAAFIFATQFGKSFFYIVLDFQKCIIMLYSLCYVPMEKVIEYYETVVMARLEDVTRTQASTVADGGDEEEYEDKPQSDKG